METWRKFTAHLRIAGFNPARFRHPTPRAVAAKEPLTEAKVREKLVDLARSAPGPRRAASPGVWRARVDSPGRASARASIRSTSAEARSQRRSGGTPSSPRTISARQFQRIQKEKGLGRPLPWT